MGLEHMYVVGTRLQLYLTPLSRAPVMPLRQVLFCYSQDDSCVYERGMHSVCQIVTSCLRRPSLLLGPLHKILRRSGVQNACSMFVTYLHSSALERLFAIVQSESECLRVRITCPDYWYSIRSAWGSRGAVPRRRHVLVCRCFPNSPWWAG